MAIGLFRTNAAVTLAPGAFTADAATGLRFGTGSNANAAGNWGSSGGGVPGGAGSGGGGSSSYLVPAGTLIEVDPAAPLGVALGGAGNLTAVTRGQETGGTYGTAN